MDKEDKSPDRLDWLHSSFVERQIKPALRRPAYSLLTLVNNFHLSSKYKEITDFEVDKFLLGQRGNDYSTLRRKANSILQIKDKDIFIAGCGTGRDILSWLKYKPRKITAVDYFNYSKSWDYLINKYKVEWPDTKIEFFQADLTNLSVFYESNYDVISSEAVLEHVTNLESVFIEFFKILKKNGLLYSTFGPIWTGYHGDHFSGWDKVENGFNHLLLDEKSYKEYLALKKYQGHSEDDGRTWIENNLFSYLRPSDYIDLLNDSHFTKIYTKVLIEPKALKCFSLRPDIKQILLKDYSLMDLLITGMSIFFQKQI